MSGFVRNVRRGAFTLVELLVVVTILVVLATMFLTALDRAGAAANSAVCASNLHQLDLAVLNYAGDNFGHFPDSSTNGGNWWWDISTDVRDKTVAAGASRGVFYCPAGEYQNSDDLWTFNAGFTVIGYAWVLTQSNHLDRTMTTGNQTISTLNQATSNKTLIADGTLCDSAGNFCQVVGGWVGVHRSNHIQAGAFKDESLRKPTGGNRLQGDGSIGWIPFAQQQPRTTGIPQFWW